MGNLEECDKWVRESMGHSVRNMAWSLWDEAGRPEDQSDRFWHEAEWHHRMWWWRSNM